MVGSAAFCAFNTRIGNINQIQVNNMTNEQLASDSTANKKSPVADNLIHLEGEVKAANQARDINAKINLLEDSLTDLQTELDSINKSVDEGLDQLSNNDLDLTSKVSETYKRLGEIDETYKTLTSISNDIDSEVKKLTVEISEVADQSAAELEKLEASSSAKNIQLNEQHEQLVTRVNGLVKNSAETNAQLTQSIKDNTDALLKLEKEIVTEIESLANVTEERDNELASNLNEAEKEIESGKARMLQLQRVDEALAKRATALEISATELIDKTRAIDSSIELLNTRTDDLAASTEKLIEASEKHGTLIAAIQDNAVRLALSIKELADTEKTHFKYLSGAFVLALVAIAALYFYQTSVHNDEALVAAERNLMVDQQIAGLQQENVTSELSMAEVQDGLITLNEKLQDEVKALNGKIQTMDDQVQSLDGRVNHISPFSKFGKNSVIHGPQWLVQQPAENMVIQVATVADKDELFEIATRYNRYFKGDMSYYTVNTEKGERYVLIYGNFKDTSKASDIIYRLPRYINFQRPVINRLGDIQKLITI